MIRATQENVAKVTNTMIFVPGHGAVGDKSQLVFYRDLLVNTREEVAALKKQGKSLDEIVAAKPTAAPDAKWGNGFRSPEELHRRRLPGRLTYLPVSTGKPDLSTHVGRCLVGTRKTLNWIFVSLSLRSHRAAAVLLSTA